MQKLIHIQYQAKYYVSNKTETFEMIFYIIQYIQWELITYEKFL